LFQNYTSESNAISTLSVLAALHENRNARTGRFLPFRDVVICDTDRLIPRDVKKDERTALAIQIISKRILRQILDRDLEGVVWRGIRQKFNGIRPSHMQTSHIISLSKELFSADRANPEFD
jgi:hypothetical protein